MKRKVAETTLIESKEFYSLIRRYRYQYKKYHAINDLDSEYYDENIRKSLKKAKDDLTDTTQRIIFMVLSQFCNRNNTTAEFSRNIDDISSFDSRFREYIRCDEYFKVTVDDRDFYDYIINLLDLWCRK